MKICPKCKQEKELSEFYYIIKLNKHCSWCKTCVLIKNKEWRKNNKQHSKEYFLEYTNNNKHRISQRRHKYYKKNKVKSNQQSKEYRNSHKSQLKQYFKGRNSIRNSNRKHRKQIDIGYKILENLRRRLCLAVNGKDKSSHTKELLGCTVEFLKKHLETQFTDNMNWNNYGYYGWHIDHIKPCSSFDLSKDLEQRKCFNYKNLQPLWAKDNLIKSDNI